MAHYCVQVVGYYKAGEVSLSVGETSALFGLWVGFIVELI